VLVLPPACARGAQNIDIGCGAGDCSSNTRDGEASDRNAGSRGSGWRTVEVILLNYNSILGDAGHGDTLECDT